MRGKGTQMKRLLLATTGLVAVALTSGFTGPRQPKTQQPATQPQTGQAIPVFHTRSSLVLVDVVVTNKKGKPVLGLPKSDFQLFENGKPQQISVFERHTATEAEQVSTAPLNLPAGMYSNQPRYHLTSAADVILLDDMNTPLGHQVYAITRLRKVVKQIPRGTQIAMFALTDQLQMINGFSTRRSALLAALSQTTANRSAMMNPNTSAGMTLLTNIAAGAGVSGTALAAVQQFQADQSNFTFYLRARITFTAMDELARYLTTIPGRKNLIWFTENPPPIVAGGDENMGQQGAWLDFRREIKKMDSLMALARVAVYPVDVQGLNEAPEFKAENTMMNPQLMNSTPVAGGQQMSQALESQTSAYMMRNFEEQGTAWEIAEETGGKAYINTNAIGRSLPAAISNGSNYYTLGYVPENRNYNGAYRNIRVKLEEGHYKLQYRRGYYALDPKKKEGLVGGEVNPMVAAMQPGSPMLSQVLFHAQVSAAGPQLKTVSSAMGNGGQLSAKMKNPRRMVVNYWINPTSLNMTKLPNGNQTAKLELAEVVYNGMGFRENYQDIALDLNLTPAQAAVAEKDGVHLNQLIDVPQGVSLLQLGVQNLDNERIGTLQIPVTAPKTR